ncbi:Type I phosphodiesterase / nucleotide pyrophosphatase [Chitinophaga jiangningensis]|uniref:Type I phosphodiesterase / nucleotide pyrophosphatase n=1 Tax=Chitinophaga jiangningensis TaxID=1419482 RepID=A0A1M6ZZ31_9BACT|nr:alkaline phosphatase family protein [Chitinophaga jiangningensis]SHL35619.1 Type I phosphodiesterase / nucleotide pyrophosphatase [Chitinophaga jiangningensis]
MKLRKLAAVAILSLLAFNSHAQKAERVLILGLDGFSTAGFKTAKHPHIDTLFSSGVLSITTRPVMPSVTLPNWTSHLTGSGPEEHGVTANDWTVSKHSLEPLAKDAAGYYPSVFQLLKENVRDVKTAFYYNWAELINAFNPQYLDEVSFEANDAYTDNYNKALAFMKANRKQPTLVFLYSVHTDHAGHKNEWMSAPYIQAIEAADSAIGNLLARMQAEGLDKGTHFLLITDHGGKGHGHGGVSMDEMQVPWAITGPQIKQAGLVNIYNSNKNTSQVIAKIFGIKTLPEFWTGVVPAGVFKK